MTQSNDKGIDRRKFLDYLWKVPAAVALGGSIATSSTGCAHGRAMSPGSEQTVGTFVDRSVGDVRTFVNDLRSDLQQRIVINRTPFAPDVSKYRNFIGDEDYATLEHLAELNTLTEETQKGVHHVFADTLLAMSNVEDAEQFYRERVNDEIVGATRNNIRNLEAKLCQDYAKKFQHLEESIKQIGNSKIKQELQGTLDTYRSNAATLQGDLKPMMWLLVNEGQYGQALNAMIQLDNLLQYSATGILYYGNGEGLGEQVMETYGLEAALDDSVATSRKLTLRQPQNYEMKILNKARDPVAGKLFDLHDRKRRGGNGSSHHEHQAGIHYLDIRTLEAITSVGSPDRGFWDYMLLVGEMAAKLTILYPMGDIAINQAPFILMDDKVNGTVDEVMMAAAGVYLGAAGPQHYAGPKSRVWTNLGMNAAGLAISAGLLFATGGVGGNGGNGPAGVVIPGADLNNASHSRGGGGSAFRGGK
jgi:hypothetical protein